MLKKVNSKKQFNSFDLVLSFLGAVILLFIIAPLLGMFLKTSGFEIIEVAKEKDVQQSIWLTLGLSMLGTLLLSVFAVPLSYILARKQFFLKRVVSGMVDLPIVIPHSAAGIALLTIVSRETLLGKLANSAGISIIGSPIGIMLAMSFVSIPFLINAGRDGFSSVPEHLEKAALTLGASPVRVFFTISIPLAGRYIITGVIMMWARGLSEFGAVMIIAYHPMVTPVLIFERFTAFGLKYSRPVAVLFVAICLFIFIFLRLLSGNRNDKS